MTEVAELFGGPLDGEVYALNLGPASYKAVIGHMIRVELASPYTDHPEHTVGWYKVVKILDADKALYRAEWLGTEEPLKFEDD